ncbi:MAG TPA: MFS transporter [Steroidobacteraceae bacterium]|nr:MFS transporter [Steroidobacteraceae bacterium]
MRTIRIRTLVFAMLFGFAFTGYIQRQGISVAAERIMPDLGLSQVQIGWVMTAFLFTYTVFQIPMSLVGQVVGARRMLTAIGLTTAIASVLTASAPLVAATGVIFITLLMARGVLGAAQAALFPVVSGTIRHWYPVGTWSSLQGLTVTGLWFGAAAASPLIAWLMQAYGWQKALVYSSVPSLALVALWWWFARDRPDQHAKVSKTELLELAGNPSFDASAPLTWKRVLRVLSDPQILLITLSYTIMNYVFYLVMFWSFLYLVQERKLSVLESGWLAALPFLVAGVAAAAGGRLADSLRAYFGDTTGMRIIPLTALPLAALFLYLTVAFENPYWAVAALCMGFACVELNEGPFWGAAMRLQPSDTMAATAVVNTGGNLGGVVATPIIAALSAGQDWRLVFMTGAATSIVAALLWLKIDAGRVRI